MADDNQLRFLIEKRPTKWNQWREGNLEKKINLSGASFRKGDLRFINFSNADLSSTNFVRANLEGANLYGANLEGADLYGANLKGADIRKACFYGADLREARIERTNIKDILIDNQTRMNDKWQLIHTLVNGDGTGKDLRNIDFSQVIFGNTDLCGSDFRGSNLHFADLSCTNLSSANLYGANLIHANLRNTCLDRETKIDRKWRLVHTVVNKGGSGRKLKSADLSSADLRNVEFTSADLSNADFTGTDLRQSDLKKTRLISTKLIFANLRNGNFSNADMSNADLYEACLEKATLRKANLTQANLYGADLYEACLERATLRKANLVAADLRKAKLNGADLRKADLRKTYCDDTDLTQADLRGANLKEANFGQGTKIDNKWQLVHTLVNEGGINRDLTQADLRGANLSNASLTGANFKKANLSHADLRAAHLLKANFKQAILTGACIADWQIGISTSFDGVQCDYIFRTYDTETKEFTGRLPVNLESTFAPGEFEKWTLVRQEAWDTIDITFTNGVNWRAFFQSFQELCQQYPSYNIEVQGMEQKGDVFLVRLKLETEVAETELEKLKGDIETAQKQLYSTQISLSSAQGEINVYREMMGIVKTLAGKSMGNQYFYDSVGNVANVNHGEMKTAIHKNYGTQADELCQLLNRIQELAQLFPDSDKETALACVEDLSNDLQQPKPNFAKLKTRFIALLGIAIVTGTHIATATDFANNVLELSEKLSIPADIFQPQIEQLQEIRPDFNWNPAK
mgnify:CR=1 FL=1